MEYVVMTAQAYRDKNICTKIAQIATTSGCHIHTCAGQTLQQEMTFYALITGNWNNVAKFETAITAFSQSHECDITVKRIAKAANETPTLAYSAEIIALEKINTLSNLCTFFTERLANIESIDTHTYLSKPSNTPMIEITLSLSLPVNTLISDLRDDFLLYCEELNVDGALEPEREG